MEANGVITRIYRDSFNIVVCGESFESDEGYSTLINQTMWSLLQMEYSS